MPGGVGGQRCEPLPTRFRNMSNQMIISSERYVNTFKLQLKILPCDPGPLRIKLFEALFATDIFKKGIILIEHVIIYEPTIN